MEEPLAIKDKHTAVYLESRFEYESVLDNLNEIENRLNDVPEDISVFVNETAGFADEAKAISKRYIECNICKRLNYHSLQMARNVTDAVQAFSTIGISRNSTDDGYLCSQWLL